MSEDLHPIDDLFRSGLEGKEDAPTPKVWENIEAELDKKEKRPAAGFFGRKVAAALVVLLGSAALFAAGYFIGGSNHHHSVDELPALEPSKPRGGPADTSAQNNVIALPEQEAGPSIPSGQSDQDEKIISGSGTDGVERSSSSAPVAGSQQEKKTGAPVSTARNTERANIDGASVSKDNGTSYTKAGKQSLNTKKTRTAPEPAIGTSPGLATAEIEKEGVPLDNVSEELPPMDHQPATAKEVPANHPMPQPAKTVNSLAARQSASTLPENARKNIPVANKKKGNLDLPSFALTPVIAYQSNSNAVRDNGTRWGEEMKEGIKSTEHSPARISGGILADLRVSRNVTLQTGLVLMQRDVHIDPKRVWAVKDIDGKIRYRFDCSAGTYFLNPKQGNNPRPGDTASTRFSTNALNYINLPINLKWHFGNSKLQFFAAAGAGMNFLLNQDLNAQLNHQYHYEGGRATNLKSSFFNGMIGAGMNYSLGDKFGFTLSPQYQFAITPMNENMPVKAMPRSFTVQAGLQIKLK